MKLTPIVVDLDDTLAKTDLFFESLLVFIKQNPVNLFRALLWLLKKDKAYLKSGIAQAVNLNAATIPYNQPLIDWLKDKKRDGHQLILATASHRKYADAVADHLGLFDEVLATENGNNLKGINKQRKLIELYGEKGFTYVGDSQADLKVWRSAQSAVYVGSSQQLKQRVQNLTQLDKEFFTPKNRQSVFNAIRVHQWVKNVLIFIPLLTSHNLFNPSQLSAAVLAFFAFSLCASAVYVLNDFFDLEDDRKHRSKYKRAFASGEISIVNGGMIFSLCLLGSLLLSLIVGMGFFWVIGIYFCLTLLYSLYLKSHMMIDIIILAGLYTLRIFAGAVAIQVELSFWLLAFSIFIFFSLAIMKRYIEILALKKSATGDQVGVRGYRVADIQPLAMLGTASGCIAVLIMALYVNSPDVTRLYSQPQILWAVCPVLLFWISRAWLDANRGRVDDDPVMYVIKDAYSWLCALIVFLLFFMAV